jgi:hypothetical protein
MERCGETAGKRDAQSAVFQDAERRGAGEECSKKQKRLRRKRKDKVKRVEILGAPSNVQGRASVSLAPVLQCCSVRLMVRARGSVSGASLFVHTDRLIYNLRYQSSDYSLFEPPKPRFVSSSVY